jgi:DNA-directed RNA polymerase subunit RPC12/RpoP
LWKSLSEEKRVVTTLIIECLRCGRLLMAAEEQKTRTCPYCGSRIEVRKAKRIASAPTAFEASQILRKLKSKKGFTS